MVIILKTVPSMDSDLLEAKSISACRIVLSVLVLYDKIQDLRTCVLPLLSCHLKFYLALQQCEKMSTQCPTPNSFASLKVTTGGRRHAAIDAESDRVSSLCSSTSTSWSSHDSTTLLIDTISTCGGHCRPMPSVLEAVCCSAEKLQILELAD